MKSVAVLCLLASVLLAACVSPAKPTAPGATTTAAVPRALDGVYDVEFHSTWFGPLRTTMTAQAIPARDGTPASFKANTRPGIAWDLVGGVQQVLGPILAPYIFPQGMLLTWQSTMPDPASGTVGEGRIGISKVGPFGAKTRMKEAAGPIEIVARLVHVEPDRVHLVAGGLGQALAGGAAEIGPGVLEAKGRFRDHPRIAWTAGQTHDLLAGIGVVHHRGGGLLVGGPRDDDVGVGLDLEQRHGAVLLKPSPEGTSSGSNRQTAGKPLARRRLTIR